MTGSPSSPRPAGGPAPYACPACRAGLDGPVAACPACGLRLAGPDADRLRAVLGHLASLEIERRDLLVRLARPETAGPPATTWAPGAIGAIGVDAAYRPAPAGRGVQQVLFGIGGLLLLSGAAFFVAVVWLVIGLLGQALVMAAATAAAFVASRAAARRRLAGGRETAGAIAVGLLALDLHSAWRLDLLGLHQVPGGIYAALVLLPAGLLLVRAARPVSRTGSSEPAPPSAAVYLPAGSVALVAAVWGLAGEVLAHLARVQVAAPLLLTGVAAWSLAVALGCTRDVAAPGTAADLRGVGSAPRAWAGAAAVCSAVLALAVGTLVALAGAYELGDPVWLRYSAAAAALVPLLGAVAALRWSAGAAGRDAGGAATSWGLIAWVAALPALGSPALDVPRAGLVIAGVLLALAAVLALLRRDGVVVPAAGAAVSGVLGLVVLALSAAGAATGTAFLGGGPGDPGEVGGREVGGLPVAALAAVPLALTALGVLALLRRAPGGARWAPVASGAAWVAALVLVRDLHGDPRALALTGACLLLALGAAGARWGAVRASRPITWAAEPSYGLAASLLAALALLAAGVGGPGSVTVQAGALAALGLAALAYSALPERLAVAYAGSLLVSGASWTLSADAAVHAVEAYSAPLAALLLAVGLVQWHRDPARRSMLTLGPALSVAVVPTLWRAVEDGDSLRLGLSAVAALVLLLGGARLVWQAPVVVGGGALVVLAVTQGGPYAQYLPGFLTLSVAGAVLLAVAVGWEHALAQGRRAVTWLGDLR